MLLRIYFPAAIPLASQYRFCGSLPGQLAGMSTMMTRAGPGEARLRPGAVRVESFPFISGSHAGLLRGVCSAVPSEEEIGFDAVSYLGRALVAFSRDRYRVFVTDTGNPSRRFLLTPLAGSGMVA